MRNRTRRRQRVPQGCIGTAVNVLLYLFAFTMTGLAIWSMLFPAEYSSFVHGPQPEIVPTAIIMSPATPRNADPPAVVLPAEFPIATPTTPRNADTVPAEVPSPVSIPAMQAPPEVEMVPPEHVMSAANEEWLRTLLPEHAFPPAEPDVITPVELVPPEDVSSPIYTEFACTRWGRCSSP